MMPSYFSSLLILGLGEELLREEDSEVNEPSSNQSSPTALSELSEEERDDALAPSNLGMPMALFSCGSP